MFSKFFGVKATPSPLTDRESLWKTHFSIGSSIEYMGIKGIIHSSRDLYTARMDTFEDEWNVPAHVVMRYVNNNGDIRDIKLYEQDLF